MAEGMFSPGTVAASVFYPKFQAFARTRGFGLAAALLSFAALLCYVFLWAPYQDFLFSDMAKFWNSAMSRLDGAEFEEAQFVAWPPLYHIFLAELFRLLRWLGLEEWVRLETALGINIIAFAVSVYALQRVAVQWFARSELILITVLLYAFGFPSLYFNAFLLSGNLGMPLMICAYVLIVHKPGWWAVAAGALLLALGASVRPSFAPYGLAFILFFLARHGWSRQFFGRAALFSAVFFALVLLGSLEVARISGGRVFGLSANAGLDFFINMSNYHAVDTNYDGWHFIVVVPALSWQPENGTFYTNVPFYNQAYYFQQGWEFLKRYPMRLFRGFEHMGHLFFADMLPSRPDAPGFAFWRPVWDWFKFGMFLTLGLYAWMWRRLGEHKPAFVLMISTVILTLIISAVFTGEPRYTYSILFMFYLLFFKLLELYWQDRKGWLRSVVIYGSLLLAITAVVAGVNEIRRQDLGPRSVRVSLPASDGAARPIEFDVRRLRFPFSKDKPGLFHVAESHPPLLHPGPVRMQTRMEILGAESALVEFEVYSAWAFRLSIDKREQPVNITGDFFTPTSLLLQLEPGWHDIEINMDYVPAVGGFAAAYNYWEPGGWRVRRPLGVGWDMVQFALPETAGAAAPDS
ncbi:MAG TPA: hypothetical protein VFX02_12425 [Gammaproteobacteria bacterium]|nr:hypothetical protein [Gammaproteobacteria bacterium]